MNVGGPIGPWTFRSTFSSMGFVKPKDCPVVEKF